MRDRFTAGPKSWAVWVVLGAIALSLFSKFPFYTGAGAPFPGSFSAFDSTPYGRAITWWLEHPFQKIPVDAFFAPTEMASGPASHCEKLNFRAFLPLVNSVVGGGIWTLVAANHLAAILGFFFVYRICLRATSDPVLSTVAVWSWAVCWGGAWGFNDVVFGDAVAVTLLLAVLMTKRPWLIVMLMLAAALTDERALFAGPALVIFRLWEKRPPFGDNRLPPDRAMLVAAAAPVLIGMASYIVGRAGAVLAFNLHTGTHMIGATDVILYHFYVSYPSKIFGVFEFLWIWPIFLTFQLWTGGALSRWSRFIYPLGLFAVVIPAVLVWDIDRSLFYFLPGMLAALCFSSGSSDEKLPWAWGMFFASSLWMAPNASVLRSFIF